MNASFSTVGATLATAVFLRYRSRVAVALGLLLVAGIVISYFADLTPVKPYKRFLAAINNGMTETEVISVLHREFPQNGRFPVPVLRSDDTNRLMFFLDPKQDAYNAEGVFVTLQHGKVVAKDYSSGQTIMVGNARNLVWRGRNWGWRRHWQNAAGRRAT